MDQHRLDDNPDSAFHFDADPDPDLTPVTLVGKKIKFFKLLFTAVPVYIVLSFSLAS